MKHLKRFIELVKETVSGFLEDKAPKHAAALAYYTIFSIAPLLILIISILGLVFQGEDFSQVFMEQITSLVGENGATAFQGVMEAANKPEASIIATIISVITLFFGATGVFVQLKDSINIVWNVEEPKAEGIKGMVKVRAIGLAAILAIGFLLMVSLIASALISAVTANFASEALPWSILVQVINQLLSVALLSVLFALMYRYLPDTEISWRDVWVGAILTSILFNIGKFLIGIYLGNSNVGSMFGAAGSILIVLVWVYYSAQILLFGAEFTQVFSENYGSMKQKGLKRERKYREAKADGVNSESEENVDEKSGQEKEKSEGAEVKDADKNAEAKEAIDFKEENTKAERQAARKARIEAREE